MDKYFALSFNDYSQRFNEYADNLTITSVV